MSNSKSKLTDEDIARIVQKGKSESFGLLVKRYEAKIMCYAKRFLFNHNDVEDLVQEIFIKAYTNIQSFDASRRFSPWIYRIAHNEFINAIKKKGKEPLPLFDLDIIFPRLVSKERTESKANKKELHRILNKCLNKLNSKYREPLVLRYFEELDYKEIADILHIPISTVGIRLKRGKEKMKYFCKKLNYYE